MIVDVHAHYLPPTYRRALASAGIDRPDGFPYVPEWTVRGAIAEMDENAIDVALLSISSPGFGFARDPAGLARVVNEEGAEAVRAHASRLGLLASLPLPDVDGALVELERAADELDADGFLLLTNYDGVYLGDERFEQVMAELDRRRAVVALHPTSPPACEAVSLGRPRPMLEFPFDTTRAVTNLLLGGTLDRYPNIRIIVPHAGAALPVLGDRIEAFTRAFGGGGAAGGVLAALGRLHYDLAGEPLPNALPAVLRLAGEERVLYGSDAPFNPSARVASGLARLRAALAGGGEPILAGNARALFPRVAANGIVH